MEISCIMNEGYERKSRREATNRWETFSSLLADFSFSHDEKLFLCYRNFVFDLVEEYENFAVPCVS